MDLKGGWRGLVTENVNIILHNVRPGFGMKGPQVVSAGLHTNPTMDRKMAHTPGGGGNMHFNLTNFPTTWSYC